LGADWHSRTDLRRALDKPRLNASDVGALQQLVNAGRIEVREVNAVHTDMIRRLEYRIVDQEAMRKPKRTRRPGRDLAK
jgi:hypothetical protein